MNIRSRMGPSTLPWGTPLMTFINGELAPSTIIVGYIA